jgi:hypothetical protein
MKNEMIPIQQRIVLIALWPDKVDSESILLPCSSIL